MVTQDLIEGAGCRLTVTFRNPDTHVVEDVPEPVTFRIQRPTADPVEVVAATRISLGTYRGVYVSQERGVHEVQALSAGLEPIITEDSFEVVATRVPA